MPLLRLATEAETSSFPRFSSASMVILFLLFVSLEKIHVCSFGSLGSLILVGWKEFSFTIVGVIRYVISSI